MYTKPNHFSGGDDYDEDFVGASARNWATAAHLSALLFICLAGFPAFVGPLIIWLAKRDKDPFVEQQAREALNFHLTMLLGWAIGFALIFTFVGICITVPLFVGVGVGSVVCTIIGAIQASDGLAYRYPATIRFVSAPRRLE